MANTTISTVGIVNGQIVYAEHVKNIINALDGTTANTIIITGDFIQGDNNISNGRNSFVHGQNNQALGEYTHTEGVGNFSLGDYSHAEGNGTVALQYFSHTEGDSTVTNGIGAHAEGHSTNASGDYSHAEGESSITNGVGSHAGGAYTIATAPYQTVFGQFNTDNNNTDVFVIGVGADNASRKDGFGVNTGGAYITNNLYLPDLTNTPQTNLVTINPLSGQLFYISSSNFVIDTSSFSFTTKAGGPENSIQFNVSGTLSGSSNLMFSSSNLMITGSTQMYGYEQIFVSGSNVGLQIYGVSTSQSAITGLPYLVPATDRYMTTVFVPSASSTTYGQIWNLTYGPNPTHIFDITSSKGDIKFRGRIGNNGNTGIGRLGGNGLWASNLNRLLVPDGGFSGTKVGKLLVYNPNTIGNQTLGFTASIDSSFELSLIDYSCSFRTDTGSGYGITGYVFFTSNNPIIYTPSNTIDYYTTFGTVSGSTGDSFTIGYNGPLLSGSILSSSIASLSSSNANISGSGKYLPVGFYMSTFDSNNPTNEQFIDLTPSLTASFGVPEGKLFSGSFVGSTLTATSAYSYLGAYNTDLKRIYCLINLINNNNQIGIVEIDNTSTPTIIAVNTGSIGGAYPGSVPHISYNTTNKDVIINDVGTLRIFKATSSVNWSSSIFSVTLPVFSLSQILPISNSFYAFGTTNTVPNSTYNVYKITSGSGGYTVSSGSYANSFFNTSTCNAVSTPAFASSSGINKFIAFDRSDIVPSGSSGTAENPPTTYARDGYVYSIDTASLTTSSYFTPYGLIDTNGYINLLEFRNYSGSLLSYFDSYGRFIGSSSFSTSSLSASYALTASYVLSSSYSTTASYALNGGGGSTVYNINFTSSSDTLNISDFEDGLNTSGNGSSQLLNTLTNPATGVTYTNSSAATAYPLAASVYGTIDVSTFTYDDVVIMEAIQTASRLGRFTYLTSDGNRSYQYKKGGFLIANYKDVPNSVKDSRFMVFDFKGARFNYTGTGTHKAFVKSVTTSSLNNALDYRLIMKKINVTGNGASGSKGFEIAGGRSCVFEDIEIKDFDWGFEGTSLLQSDFNRVDTAQCELGIYANINLVPGASAAAAVWQPILRNCRFRGVTTTAIGCKFEGVEHPKLYDCGWEGTNMLHAVYYDNRSNSVAKKISIYNPRLEIGGGGTFTGEAFKFTGSDYQYILFEGVEVQTGTPNMVLISAESTSATVMMIMKNCFGNTSNNRWKLTCLDTGGGHVAWDFDNVHLQGNPTTPANVVDTVTYPDIWVGTPPSRTVKISPRTL